MKAKILISLLLLFFANLIISQPIEQTQKILASDGFKQDNFGYSVSIYGNQAIVGAYGKDDLGQNSGAAYIFYNNNGIWKEQTKLLPSDGAEKDNFGKAVCIYEDYAFVGANADSDNGFASGSVYIFHNNGGIWEEQKKLVPSDGAFGEQFGSSISVSKEWAIIGAPYGRVGSNLKGTAYIYYNNSGNWEEVKKLIASDGEKQDHFGESVSIFKDYAIIGAPFHNDKRGAAYLFYNNVGTWKESKILTAEDGKSNDRFGYSVSIYNKNVIIGAYNDSEYKERSGAVYIYYNILASSWIFDTKLKANDYDENDYFGKSVSIYKNQLLIGAPGDNGGSAYLFKKGTFRWEYIKKLKANDGGNDFAESLSLSKDFAIIGSHKDSNHGSKAGAAYIFGPPRPKIQLQPKSISNICVDQIITLSISGIEIDSFQWQLSKDKGISFNNISNSNYYIGANSDSLNIVFQSNMNENQYRCIVFNKFFQDTSIIVQLETETVPPEITTELENQIIEANEDCSAILPDYKININVTDNCGIDSIIQIPKAGLIISGKTNNISIIIKDNAGNITKDSFNVEVIDNLNPEITCISDIVKQADSSHFYKVIGNEFDPLSSSDNCNIISITNNQNQSNTLENMKFPEGETIISWTIEDDSGNQSTCNFSVNIGKYTGTNDVNPYSIKIFPNPSKGIFKILNNDISIGKITIINTKLQVIYEIDDPKHEDVIDISAFTPGIYILVIKTDKENIVKKIVKH